jgi:large subunit ribosomal protein L25
MKKIEIIGYNRANLGKQVSNQLRLDGNVPCVVYGGKEQVHFYSPMILFKDIVYTPEAHIIDVNIEGDVHTCVIQDVQFHPVSDIIMHADFLEVHEDKPVKIEIPVKFVGKAPGLIKGGKLIPKLRKIKIKALPDNLPDFIVVDISELDLGKSVKVKDVKAENFEILTNPLVTIATIEVPRALKGTGLPEAEEKK